MNILNNLINLYIFSTHDQSIIPGNNPLCTYNSLLFQLWRRIIYDVHQDYIKYSHLNTYYYMPINNLNCQFKFSILS